VQKLYKILIVDDDETNCEVLIEILEEHFQLEVAYSGKEGLEKALIFKPDIILLDIMMPEMDGYEVCRKVKQNSSLATTKIILVSAKRMLKDRLIGYEAGADDYITKPYDHNELNAKINVFSHLKYTEELNKLKDDFLTLLTHESKTPLNIILGYSELLSMSSNLSDDEKEFAEAIIKAAQQLHTSSSKTLFLCKLKSNYQLALHRGALEEIIEELIQKYTGNTKNISFKFDYDLAKFLMIDAPIISKSISYIIDNAIKHSNENDVVNVSIETKDPYVIVTIKDKGPGISNENKEIIFGEFNNADIDHHSQGLGISLAIAKRVATLHGGNLTVEDNNPTGAVFKFHILNNIA
jgi:two-component system, sensor histidine kinase and response regulator